LAKTRNPSQIADPETKPLETFLLYLSLGWEHIVSPEATDHQLFLMAMIAPFSWRNGKRLLVLITAFTIGHSLTLAFSSTGSIRIPSYGVELLIPFTIFLTALFHGLKGGDPKTKGQGFQTLYNLAGLFGLIHGLGFANTLKALLGREESLLLPLAGFNLGIELGQILVLFLLLGIRAGLETFIPKITRFWPMAVPLIAGAGSLWMIWERV
jgi:hypothetical protein